MRGSPPNWARQMRIFILEDLGEIEAATVLLGGLLASGEVTESKEIHFLTRKTEGTEGCREIVTAAGKTTRQALTLHISLFFQSLTLVSSPGSIWRCNNRKIL